MTEGRRYLSHSLTPAHAIFHRVLFLLLLFLLLLTPLRGYSPNHPAIPQAYARGYYLPLLRGLGLVRLPCLSPISWLPMHLNLDAHPASTSFSASKNEH